MVKTRQQIITILENRKFASASEISKILRTTRQNINYHIIDLIEDGIVEHIGFKTLKKPGRPAALYGLSRVMEANNLDRLASALLHEYYGNTPEKDIDKLKNIAKRLINNDYLIQKNLTQQLVNATQYLANMGYQSKWEAHSINPRIRFNHCPYNKILASHPELCLMDKFLLEELLKVDVRQSACRKKDKNGTLFCLFEIIEN